MGAWWEHICPDCGYKALVGGCNDSGLGVIATTIVCKTCKELSEAVLREVYGDSCDWRDVKVRCPKSESHEFERWRHPGPCPKCGAIMERDEDSLTLWDDRYDIMARSTAT